jgi:hypothetical protein
MLSGMFGRVGAGSDFDKMKALVGEWDTTSPEGKYRITLQKRETCGEQITLPKSMGG